MSKIPPLNALLEIGCEEIPARFMPGLLENLQKIAEEKLQKERLTFSRIQTLGTPRRLTLYIENLASGQADITQEIKGPPKEVAFDKDGQPTPAALGFASRENIPVDKLIMRYDGKREYVYALVVRKGQATQKVLATLFPEIMAALYQPLSMRWGEIDFKFIRPIHWILALCGAQTVKFELAGIKTGNQTSGIHSKLKNSSVKIKTADLTLYKKQLLALGVMVDQNEREALIKKQVYAAAKKLKGTALVEKDLLAEVNFLVEDPLAYVGQFNQAFLALPQEVLITSMKKHQKYFPVLDVTGKLLPYFVVVTNGCKNAGVVDGNQKVLSARLTDAKFFFEEDRKQPLKAHIPALEKVAFFEKLGSMANKAQRLSKLSSFIGEHLRLSEAEIEDGQRIALLCKADLVTKMVYEFPELQGTMGREYALLSGEKKEVAVGIFEHYLPRFAEDSLPQTPMGICMALADRFDSLVGCFSMGKIPTGSQDPYALRRAAHGIIRIILEKKIALSLDEIIEQAYQLYALVFLEHLSAKGETGYQDFNKIKAQLLGFLAGRLKPILIEDGLRYDVVEAVLVNFNAILDTVEKSRALNAAAAKDWFDGLVMSADRVARITKGMEPGEVNKEYLLEKEERDLFDVFTKVNCEVEAAINGRQWQKALEALASMSGSVNVFFDKILVMHKDENIKQNRLALLKSIRLIYDKIGDFSKVVLSGKS